MPSMGSGNLATGLRNAIQHQLGAMGEQHKLLQEHTAKVYAKNWWKNGDKKQHQGGELFYWRQHGAPDLKLAGLGQQPPIQLLQDWNEDIAVYQDNVQSGVAQNR